MAKISIHRGITVPNPDNKYNMFKADITIDEIDTEGDVDEQIKQAFEVYDKISNGMNEPLTQSVADVANLSIEGLGLATEFEEFQKNDKVWKESVVVEVKKLQKAVEDANKSDG